MRLPLAVDIGTRDGTLEKDSLLTNAIVDVEAGVPMVRKRPGIYAEFASETGQGQGLFVWSPAGFPVLGAIVNDTTYPELNASPLPKRLKFTASTVIDWKIQTNYSPSVTVQAVSSNGFANLGYSGNVTLSIVGANPQGAVLSGHTATASSGLATFASLKVSKVGRYKLKATGTAGIKPGTSAAFNIRSSIAWDTPPAPSYPNGPIDDIIAKVVDAGGATVTGFVGSLTISLANTDSLAESDKPVLSGTRTVAAVNGVATWTGLSIDLPGDWVFRVTDFIVNPSFNGVPDPTYPYPPKWVTYPLVFTNDSYGNLPPLGSGLIETGWEFAFTTLP